MMSVATPSVPQPTLPSIALPRRHEMERAYQRSDASYDGVFYLGVRTTGIFCKPSCPARKPKPENVEFFAMPKEALFAGYRPCLRCRPLDGDAARPWVNRLLDRAERHGAACAQPGCRSRRGTREWAQRHLHRGSMSPGAEQERRSRRLRWRVMEETAAAHLEATGVATDALTTTR